ncbi:Uncharacterised protein [Mycobacteroides abscessus subsp. abscessus]|nr:Uncharacterised protein [Mycobacteroides abscessus subsp. abscessus]
MRFGTAALSAPDRKPYLLRSVFALIFPPRLVGVSSRFLTHREMSSSDSSSRGICPSKGAMSFSRKELYL